MKETEKLFGKKLTYVCDVNQDEEYKSKLYHVEFKSIESIHKFYNKCREKATKINFGGNEYEKYSFIQIDNILINPPKYFNGDDNWTSYKKCEKQSYYAEIQLC